MVGGGQTGIRTLGGMTLAGFQDRCIQPALPSVHRIEKYFYISLEVPPRFELGIGALQAPALPLGDGTMFLFRWCPEPDLNRYSVTTEGF